MNYTRTLLIGLLIALGLLVVILAIFNGTPKTNTGIPNDLVEYFEQRITTLGVEDIGQPIEGFDANLLILAFPGLMSQDFEGVKTLEGHYSVSGGEITFVRDQVQPISSAERTLAPDGYARLLENVSARLGMGAHTAASIDVLIDRINTSDTIETTIDQGGSARGVRIVPKEVLEDSRCPEDVQCIQAGVVRVRALFETEAGVGEQVFVLGTAVATSSHIVTLTRVSPSPRAGFVIEPSEYRFFFEVKEE
jgi:hypothetical protein